MTRPPQRAWIKTTRRNAMRVTNTVARVLAAGAGLLLASAGLAQSPGYPDRPVKIIVPFAAAGPLHNPVRVVELHRQPEPLCQGSIRSGQGLRARHQGRRLAQRTVRSSQ